MKIYEHLLTCSTVPESRDSLIASIPQLWERAHSVNGSPKLSGSAPTVSLVHVAYWLQVSEQFRTTFLRPESVTRFTNAVAEARSALMSACKTHPTIEAISAKAIQSTGDPFWGAIIATDLDNNDDDNEGEDQGPENDPNF